MYKLKPYLVIVLVLSFLLAACQPTPAAGPATEAPGEQPKAPGEQPKAPAGEKIVVHLGYLGKPDTLNPAYAFLMESYYIFNLVLGTMTIENPDGEYIGDLATEWSHSDDGLTWTFKLRDDVKWHDGTPFTADDMVWSINAIINDPEGWTAVSSYLEGFVEARAIDATTVEITVEYPISNMEYRASWIYALPRKVFEQFTNPTDLQNFTNFEILGTGPFKMNQFDKDKGILILDANPDFYFGKPNVDQVIFQTFDNADALVQALKVGDIDVAIDLPNTAFETVKGFENVEAVNIEGRSLSELIINSVPKDHDPAPTRNVALEDPQVRLAIATAINKQDLVDIVLQGLGKVGTTIIPPSLGGGFWHNSDIKDVEFDLNKANQILEDAGYVKGADGVRAKGDVRLEFRLQYSSDSPTAPRVADLMTGWWKEVGIKASPQATDPDSLTAAITPAGDFDLVLWGWGSDPDPNFMLNTMTSAQFVEGGWSDSGYFNPEYDALYLQQQQVLDKNERRKIVWKMQEMVFNDRPYIVYWYDDILQAYRTDRFTGFRGTPSSGFEGQFNLRNIKPVK